MNSPKCSNFMTTLRQEIEEKNKRKYSNNKEQKNMQYYNLYLGKIVAIQRWFRRQVVRRNRRVEGRVLMMIRKMEYLEGENGRKKEELKQVRKRREEVLAEKENEFVQYLEAQIAGRVKKALKGTLDSADRLAENKARVRYLLGEIEQTESKKQQLEGQVEALKFQFSCHRKRKADWQQKLFKIKENILNETLKTKDIRTKLSQISRKPESMRG